MIRIKMCGVPREAGVKKLNARKSGRNASKSTEKTRVSKRTATDAQTIADLVAANRILYAQSVLDGYGHVSARHDFNPDRFWLARGMAPGLVTAGDVMEFDLSGEPLDARGRSTYAERIVIPRRQGFGILRPKEHAADSSYSFHGYSMM